MKSKSHHAYDIKNDINGSVIDDSEIVANEFNKYFLSVVREVVGNYTIDHKISNMVYRNTFVDYQETSSILLGPVIIDDVANIISMLNSRFSCEKI